MDHFVNEYFTYIVPNIFLPARQRNEPRNDGKITAFGYFEKI